MTRNRLLLVAVFSAFLLNPGGAGAQEGDLEQVLAHGPGTPPEVRVVGTERQAGVKVEDITFASVAGDAPVQAYVVRPERSSGPMAGVLFVHWFEPRSPNSNRTQFLDEAKALARRGTVSLLVSTFWSDPARYRSRRWEDDFQNSVNQAKDLRRALDVLLAQPGVDPQRIGYVGHDYGAMFGTLVAAVDRRPKAYALIAGTSRFTDWYLFGSASGVPQGEALERFKAQFAVLEPVNAVGRAKASLFFQMGESDRYTPRQEFIALYMAAPDPKRIATYLSDHPMDADVIRLDRTLWLAEQLALPSAGEMHRLE